MAQERTYTRPGRPLDLILKKAIAIVMLSASYWLLDWLFGDRWGTFGPRIAQTVIGAAFAGGMLFGSWFLISLFEHAAYYIFWGGLLIATITDMVTTLPSKKSGIGDTLAVAAFSAASLGIYIAFEGIWP